MISKQLNVYDNGRLVDAYDWSYIPLPHSGISLKPVRTIYTYDIMGNLTEQVRFFTDGTPWTKNTYSISEQHVSYKSIYLPDNSSTSNTAEFTLNSLHQIVEEKSIMNTGEIFTTSYYKYDEKGRQYEENTYRGDGSLMFRHLSTYDDKGNLIENNNPNGDQRKHIYKYSDFDKHGNWQTKIEYRDNSATEITRRTIFYHQ